MEIRITTRQILTTLQILSWVIFIGLCVESGGIVFNSVYTLAINPANVNTLWEGGDFSGLYHYDPGQFVTIRTFMFIAALLKAIMFYLIVKLFVEKKVSISKPFNLELRQFLLRVSYLALGIGLCCYFGCEYFDWLSEQKVDMPDPKSLHLDGADVWLFMAVILFVVTQFIKRGIEIQNENDLTI